MIVTDADVTRALDRLYPGETWEVTLGKRLPQIRASMRAVLEGFVSEAADRLEAQDDPEPDSDRTLGLLNLRCHPNSEGY